MREFARKVSRRAVGPPTPADCRRTFGHQRCRYQGQGRILVACRPDCSVKFIPSCYYEMLVHRGIPYGVTDRRVKKFFLDTGFAIQIFPA